MQLEKKSFYKNYILEDIYAARHNNRTTQEPKRKEFLFPASRLDNSTFTIFGNYLLPPIALSGNVYMYEMQWNPTINAITLTFRMPCKR